ncbi:MAG: NUDIX domain-containing protein [Pyrinomonadaceae bacterium]
MAEALIFGSPEPAVTYTERRAAYVVIKHNDQVALVKGQEKYFLPGGGSLPGERPEETITREVVEELARSVRLLRTLGEAIQYFYAAADDRHYRMLATFFSGEFMAQLTGRACEHELLWLPISEIEHVCFHACHAWAVRRA